MKVLLTVTSILILAGGLLLGVYDQNAAMTFAFLASVFFLFMANLDRISEFRASAKGVEARTREVIAKAETTITELQLLAKEMGKLTLSLVQRAGRWGPYEDDEKDSMRESVLRVLKKIGIPDSQIPEVLADWHRITEFDYSQAILGNGQRPVDVEPDIKEEWFSLISGGIPKTPAPSEIRNFLERHGFMNKDLEERLKDYEYYCEHKAHRRPVVWKERQNWGPLRKT